MLNQIIISFTAFIIAVGFMGITLHKAGYRKKKSCQCGRHKKCISEYKSN